MEQDVILKLGQLAEGTRTTDGAAEPPGVSDKLFDKIKQAGGVSEVAFGERTPPARLIVEGTEKGRSLTVGGASRIVGEAKVRFGLREGAARAAALGLGLAAIWHVAP